MINLRNRFVLVAVALVSLVALVIGVGAQDMTFGLGQEDFDAWSNANLMSAMSATQLGYEFTTDTAVLAEGDAFDVNLVGSGFIGAEGFTMSVTGSLSDGTEEIPAQLDVIVVEDAFYFDVGMGWVEATLEDVEETSAMAGVDSEILADPEGAITDAVGEEALGALAGVDFTQYVAMSRDGQSFRIDLLVADLLSDPAVQEALAADPDTAQFAMMAPMVLEGSEFSVIQTLGDSGMVENTDLNIIAGSEEMGFDVDFNFNVSLDYGASETIEAPADAQPFEEFMNMMLGGGF